MMQDKVLEAERSLVQTTERRKWCHDQIDGLQDPIKSVRDKIQSTDRTDDNYPKLTRKEHELLKEQKTLESQLQDLKYKEQLALDELSRLLRQSHELERLRQERAKYWQIISITLSLVGSLIALMAQRVRNQNTVMKELVGTRELVLSTQEEQTSQISILCNEILNLKSEIADLKRELVKLGNVRGNRESKAINPQNQGWSAYFPGLGYVMSWFGAGGVSGGGQAASVGST